VIPVAAAAGMAPPTRFARWLRTRRTLAAVGLAAASGLAFPATVTQPFRFTVNLESHATCNRSVAAASGGAQVQVSCGNPSDARFLLHVYRAGEWLGTVDGDMGSGTITTWRVVRAANRDYLEIMVGW
jgi:hypothetical protein